MLLIKKIILYCDIDTRLHSSKLSKLVYKFEISSPKFVNCFLWNVACNFALVASFFLVGKNTVAWSQAYFR